MKEQIHASPQEVGNGRAKTREIEKLSFSLPVDLAAAVCTRSDTKKSFLQISNRIFFSIPFNLIN